MPALILIALLTLFISNASYAASCGGRNQDACPAWHFGPPCEQGLRKNDKGKCKPCGGEGERACRVIDKGEQCEGDLIYRAGYCTRTNIACGTLGSPPCHWMKPGARCTAENTATIDGLCQHCGRLFERACPVAERGNNCVAGTRYSKGVCVPDEPPSTADAPKSRIYNLTGAPVFAQIGEDWGEKQIPANGYVEFSVPELHCVDHSQGLVDPDNELYFNADYYLEAKTANCRQWAAITIWPDSATFAPHSGQPVDTRYVNRGVMTYSGFRAHLLERRTEAVLPGGALYDKGVKAIVMAPDRDAWIAYWGPGVIEVGRQDSAHASPAGLTHPDSRSDRRVRRLYGAGGSQWLMCPPQVGAGCESEELTDYPINAVGSWWEYLEADHMVEFVLMDEDELVSKRYGLNEARHYRRYEKVGTNRYRSRYGNFYEFTSSTTGFWESGKSGNKQYFRRTSDVPKMEGTFDGVLETVINGKQRRRLVTFVVRDAENPLNLATLNKPDRLKVKRLDQSDWVEYNRNDWNPNLFKSDDGAAIRFHDSTRYDRIEFDWTSADGSVRETFYRIRNRGGDNDFLEGDWKVDGNTFEITKHSKNSITVKGLNESAKVTFQRRARNAYYFRDDDRNVLRWTDRGLWYKAKGEAAQKVERN